MFTTSTVRCIALSTLFAFAAMSGAAAQDAPAVTKLNGKAAIAGTYSDQDNQDGKYGALFLGSLTAPVSHEFGFQADTVLGTRDGKSIAGIGGHLFWRDPAKGLIGITGSYLELDGGNASPDLSVTRVGGEAELYAGPITIALTAGQQNGSNVRDGFYGSATGYWYPNDDLRLSLGAVNDPVLNTSAVAGFEYQPRTALPSGLTFFADATAGENNYTTAQIGVRFYFGDDKNLKLRNRNDDPIANLPGDSMPSAIAATSSRTLSPEEECAARGSAWFWGKGQCNMYK